MERKLLNSWNTDDALSSLDEESFDCNTCLRRSDFHPTSSGLQSCYLPASASNRSISRVLILHNDKIASFSDSCCIDNACATDFFDTPEFWSGSITWW